MKTHYCQSSFVFRYTIARQGVKQTSCFLFSFNEIGVCLDEKESLGEPCVQSQNLMSPSHPAEAILDVSCGCHMTELQTA